MSGGMGRMPTVPSQRRLEDRQNAPGITADDDPTSLGGMGSDDQIMGSVMLSDPTRGRDEASVMNGCALCVIEYVQHRRHSGQCS